MVQTLELSTDQLIERLKSCLTDDLRLRKVKAGSHPLAGHCYVAAETIYHLIEGWRFGWKPMNVKIGSTSHWFLKHVDGHVIDPTFEQFTDPPNKLPIGFHERIRNENARGRGFLTKEPSKRARELIRRMARSSHFVHITPMFTLSDANIAAIVPMPTSSSFTSFPLIGEDAQISRRAAMHCWTES